MMSEDKKERTVNYELLRILCMIMVVGCHFFGKEPEGALRGISFGTIEYFIYYWIDAMVYVCVNCFVLITAFHKIRNVNFYKVSKFWLQIEFYSILGIGIAIIVGSSYSKTDLLKCLIPLTGGSYWFCTAYILLMILSPVLNVYLDKSTMVQKEKLIVVLTIIFSIWNMISYVGRTNTAFGGNVLWFIYLYLIGDYLKNNEPLYKKWHYILLFLGITIFQSFSRILLGCLAKYVTGSVKGAGLFYGNDTLFCLLASIMLFQLFRVADFSYIGDKLKKLSYM